MRFLVDECLYFQIVDHLRRDGHDVIWASDDLASTSDADLLLLATSDNRILMSEDRDFGELIFRDGTTAVGVVIVKVGEFDDSLEGMGERVVAAMRTLGAACIGQFTVVEPGRVRQRALPRQL